MLAHPRSRESPPEVTSNPEFADVETVAPLVVTSKPTVTVFVAVPEVVKTPFSPETIIVSPSPIVWIEPKSPTKLIPPKAGLVVSVSQSAQVPLMKHLKIFSAVL